MRSNRNVILWLHYVRRKNRVRNNIAARIIAITVGMQDRLLCDVERKFRDDIDDPCGNNDIVSRIWIRQAALRSAQFNMIAGEYLFSTKIWKKYYIDTGIYYVYKRFLWMSFCIRHENVVCKVTQRCARKKANIISKIVGMQGAWKKWGLPSWRYWWPLRQQWYCEQNMDQTRSRACGPVGMQLWIDKWVFQLTKLKSTT